MHDSLHRPLVWLMVSASFLIGLFFTFFTFLPDVQNSLLYKYGVFVDLNVWGAVMCVSMLVTIVGLWTSRPVFVRYGTFVGFALWTFAALAYLLNGFFFAFIAFGLINVLSMAIIFIRAGGQSFNKH